MHVHKYLHVCVHISSYEKSPFRPLALISQNVAADPFFYVLRAFPLLFFSSSCFVFMPNHCHYNIGTSRLRFAYKFISAGFVIAAATQRQQQHRDVNWETEWLTHWPVSISVPVPPSTPTMPPLLHLPHTYTRSSIGAQCFGIAFLRILQRILKGRSEQELTRR